MADPITRAWQQASDACRGYLAASAPPATVAIFACPAHAPAGVEAHPHDDGRPACTACGASSYAVKPYTVLDRGAGTYWRLADGTVARPREVRA